MVRARRVPPKGRAAGMWPPAGDATQPSRWTARARPVPAGSRRAPRAPSHRCFAAVRGFGEGTLRPKAHGRAHRSRRGPRRARRSRSHAHARQTRRHRRRGPVRSGRDPGAQPVSAHAAAASGAPAHRSSHDSACRAYRVMHGPRPTRASTRVRRDSGHPPSIRPPARRRLGRARPPSALRGVMAVSAAARRRSCGSMPQWGRQMSRRDARSRLGGMIRRATAIRAPHRIQAGRCMSTAGPERPWVPRAHGPTTSDVRHPRGHTSRRAGRAVPEHPAIGPPFGRSPSTPRRCPARRAGLWCGLALGAHRIRAAQPWARATVPVRRDPRCHG